MTDTSATTPEQLPWFASSRLRWAAIALLAGIVLVEGYLAVFVRVNDVANHYRYGRLMLGLSPVPGPHPYHYWYVPYPAARPVLNAVIAWLPYRSFRAVCYGFGLAALAGSLVLWERMARARKPTSFGVPFAAATGSLFLLSPWIVRDMDDCGLQLILLFMLTACVYLCQRGKPGWGGVWLGVAVVYKATPLLLLPFLAVTGRWRALLTSGVTAILLSLSPALFVGWEATWELNKGFVKLARSGGQMGDPTENGFEPPRHQNQGLVMSLGRFLETYPPGHPLHLDHPMFIQFLDLPPATADKVAKVVVAGVLLYLLAWRYGRRLGLEGRDADLTRETAALVGLCALLSPMCWVQHLTLCLPAAYLVLRDLYDRAAEGRRLWRPGLVGIAASVLLIFGLSREAMGRELSLVFLSYKVNTFAALILVGLVLFLPLRANAKSREREELPSRGRTGAWVRLYRYLPFRKGVPSSSPSRSA